MKALKIILSFIMAFALLPFSVSAQSIYNAEILFNASVNSRQARGETIYVYQGDTVGIDLTLKTNDGYYAGPFAAQIFYTADFFNNGSFDLNTSGSFYSCCKTYTDVRFSGKITDSLKEKLYPSSWNQQERAKYNFYNLNMVPTAADCKSTPDNLNEKIISLSFTIPNAPSGTEGKVFIPAEAIRTVDNPTGATYLSCYTKGGDVLSDRYDYGDKINVTVDSASVSFKITDIGDIDLNGRVTSADALRILQFTTGLVNLTDSEQIRAKITGSQKINSGDALAALQISVGIKQINDFLNK